MLWEITRHVLVWYFATLSQVNVVYGSLTTAIVVLLSLEIAATLLLLGAQVISEYERLGIGAHRRDAGAAPHCVRVRRRQARLSHRLRRQQLRRRCSRSSSGLTSPAPPARRPTRPTRLNKPRRNGRLIALPPAREKYEPQRFVQGERHHRHGVRFEQLHHAALEFAELAVAASAPSGKMQSRSPSSSTSRARANACS